MNKLLTILFLLPFIVQSQTKYYVKNGGSDAANGLSDATAWATISKVNSMMGGMGDTDSILLKCGSSWHETLVEGIYVGHPKIGKYGTGAKPELNGFTTLSSWTLVSPGIYESTLSGGLSTLNILTINGVPYAKGRWPKAGADDASWLSNTWSLDNTRIAHAGMGKAIDFTGGEVVIKRNNYVIDKGNITAHNGDTLTYTYQDEGFEYYGSSFFIQNHVGILTQFGEWAYNGTTHKVTMYFGAASPGSYVIKASTITTLVSSPNYGAGLDISNLSITGANENGVLFDNGAAGTTIKNCDITLCGRDAIHATNTGVNHLTIKDNYISDCYSNAMTPYGTYMTITGNTIRNIGLKPGMGWSGGFKYVGMAYIGAHSLIELNTLTNIGYSGICFTESDSIVVQKNIIDSFGLTKADGGGIYSYAENPTTNTGRIITLNIIKNGIGNDEGMYNSGPPLIHNIYTDDNVSGVKVTNNICINSNHSLRYLHNNVNILDTGNVYYGGKYAQIDLVDDGPPNMTTITMKKNLVYSRLSGAFMITYGNSTNSLSAFGTIDSNYFRRPTDLTDSFAIRHSPSFTVQTFSQWKSTTTQDANADFSTPAWVTTSNDTVIYNGTNTPTTISTYRKYRDRYGNINDGGIYLPAFRGDVFSDIGAATGDIPPTANAGSDQVTNYGITVTLSGSGIDNGTITGYAWTKLSGGTATITSASSASTTVTGLQPGVYVFQLTVTDNTSSTGSDTITVNVTASQIKGFKRKIK
jgi:hypothetical protein